MSRAGVGMPRTGGERERRRRRRMRGMEMGFIFFFFFGWFGFGGVRGDEKVRWRLNVMFVAEGGGKGGHETCCEGIWRERMKRSSAAHDETRRSIIEERELSKRYRLKTAVLDRIFMW